MNTDEMKRKLGGRKKLYHTAKEQRAALRARQARYNEKRAQSGKNVHVFLPDDLFEKMAEAAKTIGISRNEYMKRLIVAAQEAHFSFTRPLPSIQTMKKASRLLNTAEVARLLGMAPRTLNARLKNGTPFKQVEAERLRYALAEHSLALM